MTTEEFYIRKFIRETGGFAETPEYFKDSMFVYLIIFPGLTLGAVLPPMLACNNTLTRLIFWSYAVGTIFLILWTIYIYINPYKRQRLIVLHVGISSLYFSLFLLIGAVEYTGVLAHLYVLSFLFVAIYIVILCYIFKVYIPKLLRGYRWEKSKFWKNKLGKRILGFAASFFSVAGVTGMAVAKILGNYLSQRGVYIAMAFTFVILSYIFVFFSFMIYKYYLIIKYPQFANYYEPPKEKQKRVSNKRKINSEKSKNAIQVSKKTKNKKNSRKVNKIIEELPNE
ncbi:hypothetical protein COB47_2220 [Caldicellulosiruptor obsidiansis OB47]|uniref:Uncharacterized protein n=1 Tax=Caldicellulosiruptor obsidiansis (strain ATCC BAA-2073 / JCM 16842 / OB47) TaxID=608506 RepID=D9TH67_CALOO|nr:hypothetical protein [Caldicellulosiruptor obsidiansis]ADL43464.1 hypothetical protein COB47_2220 [Caldicellulosiruptor obsidiansis OB47]